MKRGIIIAPFVLNGIFEVNLSKIESKQPLFYAYGELLAKRKGDTNFYEKAKEYAEIYRGYKEFDKNKPKTIILKQQELVSPWNRGHIALKQNFNFWCNTLGKNYFFINGLIERQEF